MLGQAFAKRRIVEVGHGQKPIFQLLKRIPLQGQSYLGLDIDKPCWPAKETPLYDLDAGRRKIARRAAEGRDCSFRTMEDLGHIPLPDGYAHEVYLSLVLNDPRISPIISERLLAESRRILRQGGQMVVYNATISVPSPGDIIIDYCTGSSFFKASEARGLGPEDAQNAQTRFLRAAFLPLPAEEYGPFLEERGLWNRLEIVPGTLFSILTAV